MYKLQQPTNSALVDLVSLSFPFASSGLFLCCTVGSFCISCNMERTMHLRAIYASCQQVQHWKMRTFFKLNRSIYIFTSELFGVVAFFSRRLYSFLICTNWIRFINIFAFWGRGWTGRECQTGTQKVYENANESQLTMNGSNTISTIAHTTSIQTWKHLCFMAINAFINIRKWHLLSILIISHT